MIIRSITSGIALMILAGQVHGACEPRPQNYYGEAAITGACGDFSTYSPFKLGLYFRSPNLQGASYTISTCGAAVDTQITGFEGTETATSWFYNDDFGPVCPSSTRASITYIPDYTDYTRASIHQYNCQAYDVANPDISFQIRQNNNLNFTSSVADMCEGDMRTLTATPASVTGAQANSGNTGTFSGSGVSGTTFTAPGGGTAAQNYSASYAFGFCSTDQLITVHRNPSTATTGIDQIVGTSTSGPLGGNTPVYGTGSWSGPAGVTFSPSASTANAVAENLPMGSNTLTWTVSNATCSPSAASLMVDRQAPALTLTIDTTVIGEADGAMATTATVTRNSTGLLTVNLGSTDLTEATVPATVDMLSSELSVIFDIAAVDDALIDGTQTATITATATGHTGALDTLDVLDSDSCNLGSSTIFGPIVYTGVETRQSEGFLDTLGSISVSSGAVVVYEAKFGFNLSPEFNVGTGGIFIGKISNVVCE